MSDIEGYELKLKEVLFDLIAEGYKILLATDNRDCLVFHNSENILAGVFQKGSPIQFFDTAIEKAFRELKEHPYAESSFLGAYKFLRLTNPEEEFLGMAVLYVGSNGSKHKDLFLISQVALAHAPSSKKIEMIVAQMAETLNPELCKIMMFCEQSREYHNLFVHGTDFGPTECELVLLNYSRIKQEVLRIEHAEFPFYLKKTGLDNCTNHPHSLMLIPFDIQDTCKGLVLFETRKQDRDWSVLDFEFAQDAVRILESLIQQHTNYAGSFRAEAILQNTLDTESIVSFEFLTDSQAFRILNFNNAQGPLAQTKLEYSFDAFFNLLEPATKADLLAQFQQCVASGNFNLSAEFEMGADPKYYNLRLFPCQDTLLGITVVLGVLKDISSYKQQQVQLLNAKHKIKESDKLKSEFMAALSYEVRSPINSIIGFSNLLCKREANEGERVNYQRIIRHSGESLIKLIDEIADVNRLESGEVTIHKLPLELNKLLKRLQVYFIQKKNELQKHQIEIDLVCPADEVVVLADESRINQMLSTLINNAVNYTQQGYVQFGYHLLQTNKRVIEFFVKDTGSGIPESKRDIIFKRYGRMDGSRMVRPGATSLGLSIVKDLVRLMGGELQVESVEGKGSAFYMQIPYEDSSTFFQKSENLELSPNAQIRILVAEDDMNTFRLIQEAIRQSSFVSTIDYASNGLEAIEKMREQQYDLLLLDLKMPLMDGMQAASYIRQKFPKPKNSIPIVAVSASVNSDTRQACIEIGISGFIQKPFSNHQIVEAINLALNA